MALALARIGRAGRNSTYAGPKLPISVRVASVVARAGAAIAPRTENGNSGSTIGSADVERTRIRGAAMVISGASSQWTTALVSIAVAGGSGMFTITRQRAITSTPEPTSANAKPASLKSGDVPP